MQVQDVVNVVSSDMRQVLSSSAPDANIILPWVDRIHKEVLHTTLYSYFNRFTTTVSVVSGTSSYSLTPTPEIRRIIGVYDRTFDRTLLPYESIGLPSNKSDGAGGEPLQMPKPLLSASTMTNMPEYYQRLSGTPNTLIIFPAPQKTAFDATYEVYYEGLVATLSSLSSTLIVPDDGLDIVAAGVNSLAAAYLKNPEDFQAWKSQYEAMKAAIFNG